MLVYILDANYSNSYLLEVTREAVAATQTNRSSHDDQQYIILFVLICAL